MVVALRTEAKLTHAPARFRVGDRSLPFSPLVSDENGLVLAINLFILERQMTFSVGWRTVEKDGYILAEWYDFLRYRGIGIFEALEHHLKSFLLGGGKRKGNVYSLGKDDEDVNLTKTNAAKLFVILRFYKFWVDGRGKSLRKYHGRTLANLSESLFSAEYGLATTPLQYSKSQVEKGGKKKKAPDQSGVAKVIDTANKLGKSETGEKYYLIASLMARAGFRAGGCSSIQIKDFFNSLEGEAEFTKIVSYRDVLTNHHLPANRKIIKQTLKDIRKTGRKLVFCVIREKTGPREGPIPIALALEIADYIWTTRADFVRRRFTSKGKRAPDIIFLSNKNRELSQEAISNKLGEVFGEAHVEGSGHMLRHAFAQELVRNLYLKERALKGRDWQAANVLETARQMLGHKNTETVETYLNRVKAQEMHLEGEPIVVVEPADAAMIRSIATALLSVNADSVRAGLAHFMEESDLELEFEPGLDYAFA